MRESELRTEGSEVVACGGLRGKELAAEDGLRAGQPGEQERQRGMGLQPPALGWLQPLLEKSKNFFFF